MHVAHEYANLFTQFGSFEQMGDNEQYYLEELVSTIYHFMDQTGYTDFDKLMNDIGIDFGSHGDQDDHDEEEKHWPKVNVLDITGDEGLHYDVMIDVIGEEYLHVTGYSFHSDAHEDAGQWVIKLNSGEDRHLTVFFKVEQNYQSMSFTDEKDKK